MVTPRELYLPLRKKTLPVAPTALPPMDPSSDPAVEATAGAIGSLITCVAIMPVDTAKVRIQAGVSTDGVLGTMQAVLKSEGLPALYRGLATKALHTMLQNWLYFFTYEWLKARRKSLGLRTSREHRMWRPCWGI